MRTYSIGDIHGEYEMLEEALQYIREDNILEHGQRSNNFRVVFLGDYVDRGPDSRKVLERLMAGPQDFEGEEWVCLMGNHEWLMVAAIDEASSQRRGKLFQGWILNGGDKTLANYTLGEDENGGSILDAGPLDAALRWSANRPLLYDDGQRYFVHAMINPKYPLDPECVQQQEAMLWMHVRKNHEEKSFQEIYGRQVVHGHSPQHGGTVFATEHRVNLDTGAVFGGALTVARWDGLQVLPDIHKVRKNVRAGSEERRAG